MALHVGLLLAAFYLENTDRKVGVDEEAAGFLEDLDFLDFLIM